MIRNTTLAYGSVSKFFHWIIFLLVLVTIPLGFVMGDIADQNAKMQAYALHKQIGVTIFTLMLLRIIWMLMNVKPILPFNTPEWQRYAERSVHFLLYALLIIVPVSGLIGSVAAGHPPSFGAFVVSLPIEQNKALSDFAFDYVHIPLVYVFLVLVSIHVLAALYHHFIKRDDILRRMLPNGRKS